MIIFWSISIYQFWHFCNNLVSLTFLMYAFYPFPWGTDIHILYLLEWIGSESLNRFCFDISVQWLINKMPCNKLLLSICSFWLQVRYLVNMSQECKYLASVSEANIKVRIKISNNKESWKPPYFSLLGYCISISYAGVFRMWNIEHGSSVCLVI